MKITDDRPVDGVPGNIKSNVPGDIQIELARIGRALREPQTDERYCQLYAAQQALAWAINSERAASPYTTIQRGLVRPLRNILEGLEDCPNENHRGPSLENDVQANSGEL